MNKAIQNDHKSIIEIFNLYKDIFPHIRSDYIKKQIDKNNVIYENDVVINYQEYKKKVKLGTVTIPKGDVILHQIVTDFPGKGVANKVFKEFCNSISSNLWLTVRSSNGRAIKFYIKNDFKHVGDIEWKGGQIKGRIYMKEIVNKEYKKWLDLQSFPEIDEKKLKKDILKEIEFLSTLSVQEYLFYRKWQKIKKTYPLKDNPFFEYQPYKILNEIKDKIWIPISPNDYENLKPELILLNNKEINAQRRHLGNMIGSGLDNNKVGRGIRFLIIDKPTEKYLGMIGLHSDYMDLKGRDDYIGWTREEKKTKLNHTGVGATIVPTQPFGYDYLGGKLMALLLTSNIVEEIWNHKYKEKLVGITTTSLFGSFSQYTNLRYWKHCGHSSGSINYVPSKDIIFQMKEYLRMVDPEKYWLYNVATRENGMPLKRDATNRIISMVYGKLNISNTTTKAGHERGIYFCRLYENTNEFLKGEITEDKLIRRYDNRFDTLVEIWKERYAKRRVKNLVKQEKFRTETMFYDGLIHMTWKEAKDKFLNE